LHQEEAPQPMQPSEDLLLLLIRLCTKRAILALLIIAVDSIGCLS